MYGNANGITTYQVLCPQDAYKMLGTEDTHTPGGTEHPAQFALLSVQDYHGCGRHAPIFRFQTLFSSSLLCDSMNILFNMHKIKFIFSQGTIALIPQDLRPEFLHNFLSPMAASSQSSDPVAIKNFFNLFIYCQVS